MTDAGTKITIWVTSSGIDYMPKDLAIVRALTKELQPSRKPGSMHLLSALESLKKQKHVPYLANHFIPNLFAILRSTGINSNLRIIGQLSKLLLRFPLSLFPQIVEYIRNLNQYSLKNIHTISDGEIFSLIKLNEFIEISHAQEFISTDEKRAIIAELIKRQYRLATQLIGMLMYMQFTIFFKLRDLLQPLKYRFDTVRSNKQLLFDQNQQVHYSEEILYKAILDELPAKFKHYLHHSYVCPETGKEVDIALLIPKLSKKIAINIDGKDHHFYPNLEQENRKTIARNCALKNAGWIVICQHIPRMSEGFKEKISEGLINEIRQVLTKLRQAAALDITLEDLIVDQKTGPKILSFLTPTDLVCLPSFKLRF